MLKHFEQYRSLLYKSFSRPPSSHTQTVIGHCSQGANDSEQKRNYKRATKEMRHDKRVEQRRKWKRNERIMNRK